MLLLGDCSHLLKDIKDNSIDLIVTDPPYGIEFMGKQWDKALVSIDTWKECFRVLKQGKLAFVMCSPRQDVLSRMIVNLQDAGFRTNYTSIYWTFASGFPKAANISKLIDKRGGAIQEENQRIQLARFIKQKKEEKGISYKDIDRHLGNSLNGGGLASHYTTEQSQPRIPTVRDWQKLKEIIPELGNEWDWFIGEEEAKREILETKHRTTASQSNTSHEYGFGEKTEGWYNITKSATEEAKKMEGAYVGFQPKPAVEVILVVSKGKTLTWLDDCRIPYNKETDEQPRIRDGKNCKREAYRNNVYGNFAGVDMPYFNEKGRFPANLLVSDDVLNDGKITKSSRNYRNDVADIRGNNYCNTKSRLDVKGYYDGYNDSGSYSRYFSLDAWAKTFPFLIVPKASKSERNNGLNSMEPVKVNDGRNTPIDNPFQRGETLRTNSHPTVKPLKLMSYLITMGSREGDLVLDPFCGSGTVCIAAHQLHRKWLGIEMNPEYAEIIKKRLADPLAQLKLTSYLEDKIPQT